MIYVIKFYVQFYMYNSTYIFHFVPNFSKAIATSRVSLQSNEISNSQKVSSHVRTPPLSVKRQLAEAYWQPSKFLITPEYSNSNKHNAQNFQSILSIWSSTQYEQQNTYSSQNIWNSLQLARCLKHLEYLEQPWLSS